MNEGRPQWVAATPAEQAQALADAINKNANLKGKYTASVDASGNLFLKQVSGSETDPAIFNKNSSIGNFEASFQIR